MLFRSDCAGGANIELQSRLRSDGEETDSNFNILYLHWSDYDSEHEFEETSKKAKFSRTEEAARNKQFEETTEDARSLQTEEAAQESLSQRPSTWRDFHKLPATYPTEVSIIILN